MLRRRIPRLSLNLGTRTPSPLSSRLVSTNLLPSRRGYHDAHIETLAGSSRAAGSRKLHSPPPLPDEKDRQRTFATPTGHQVPIDIDGVAQRISSVILRDHCHCERCVDPSSKQRHFSTAEIPANIQGHVVASNDDEFTIRWMNDVPGVGVDHHTTLPLSDLRRYVNTGGFHETAKKPEKTYWNEEAFVGSGTDMPYEAYMQDDSMLHAALAKLHTHGLLFLTGVPESEESVARIAERIGPLKNSFYGLTWDVRSVPQAINVAYTSQELGFHMDLLYMQYPPQLQFLHCMRSSAKGGASLFTDSFRACRELGQADRAAFQVLASVPTAFHYDHPESHLYRRLRTVFHCKDGKAGPGQLTTTDIAEKDFLHWVNWSPPFQAPFRNEGGGSWSSRDETRPIEKANSAMARWHDAAAKFNHLVHSPAGIHERMMKGGECVMFDNRRVLHARTAFDVGDAGKERWFRGAYVDDDAYASKWRVLAGRFGGSSPPPPPHSSAV